MKNKVLFLVLLALLCIAAAAAAETENGIVLADTEKVYLRVDRMEEGDDTFFMKMYMENRSDTKVIFTLDGVVINGYSVEPYWAIEIAPGKKANDTVGVSGLTARGIQDEVRIVEFTARAFDNNDWLADDLLKERFTLYPTGEQDNAAIREREPEDTDTVVADNENLAIIVTGYGMDEIWGYTAEVYLVNRTDANVIFAASDVSINGFMADPMWAVSVPPHARKVSSISWFNSTLEENGIEKVEEIEIRFSAGDYDDWSADSLYDEVTVLNP